MALVIYGGILIAALVAAGIAAWLRVRRYRTSAVVQTLASIVSQNLPLVPALRAAAAAERPVLRRVYTRIAQRLELGYDLSAALRAAVCACPGEISGAIQGAERGGTLAGVLQSVAARRARHANRPAATHLPLWYPLMLTVVLPVVVGFFLIMILPKFRDIFLDYNAELPRITLSLLGVGNVVGDYGIVLAILLLVVLLALVQALFARHFFTRVPDRWQPLYAVWDTLVWRLPGVRRAAEHTALAQQLPVMAAALRAGHDLGPAAEQGACVAVNCAARRRLRRWAALLAGGADPLEAATRLRFPGPFRQTLSTIHGGGDLAARFEYLTEYYAALHQHWVRVLTAAITPAMVVTWGVVVAYVAVALFLPLRALLEGVMNSID